MPKKKPGKKKSAQAVSVLGFEDTEQRGLFERRLVREVIDVDKLADEVSAFIGGMGKTIERLSAPVGDYHLDTVSLTAEVSAKGTLSLLGTGGESTGKGGVTFTFKRSNP